MAATGLGRLPLPADTAALLAPSRGTLEPPIRAEVFGVARFEQHGRSLGQAHAVQHGRSRSSAFFPRLHDNIHVLREAYRFIGSQAHGGSYVSPASEWLLDNFYLVESQLKEVHEGLPGRYFRDLPALTDPALQGLPRIYGVAWAFVAHTDCAFNEDLLVSFLDAYQDTSELTLAELWALPTTLRVVIIENLRRLAERVASNKAAREVANLCGDRWRTLTTEHMDELFWELTQRGVDDVFLTHLTQRLAESNQPESGQLSEWMGQHAAQRTERLERVLAGQMADNITVSNAVTSLRALGQADWRHLIGRASRLLRLLESHPSFSEDGEDTQRQTLHAIERLSDRLGIDERAVAQALLHRLQQADAVAGGSSPMLHRTCAYWLRGAGRGALLADLQPLARGRPRSPREWLSVRQGVAIYLCALLAGSLGLTAWVLQSDATALSGWPLALLAVMLWFPASELVVAVTNRLICEWARPARLPRLALAGGIPAEHRVLVVIPCMLTSEEGCRELWRQLERHHLANPEEQAQFALLSDWADADEAEHPQDQALLDAALQGVGALNRRYPRAEAGDAPRFIVLHRPRQLSQSEGRWIGWERKRGKLEQLVNAISTGEQGAFVPLGQASRLLDGLQYVLTLDSDTQLPPGRLRELVSIAAHPCNQPVVDAEQRKVVAGYGILQPRVATPLPKVDEITPFHRLFAGQCGIDPYSAASSEVYQDLFSEGTFTGKGLLNVRAMQAVLHGRLPAERVLSHDLLEGALVRCAVVSDVTVLEDAPFHADVAASRIHRWTRGDWQLLPLLFNARAYAFGALNRWKMLDNLRRSLVAPASLGLLMLALALDWLPPWHALLLVAAAYGAGPLMGAVAGLAPARDDIALGYFYRRALREIDRSALQAIWALATLLQQALLQIDAMSRALYRLFISRRLLLQWTTAAAAQASASHDVTQVVIRHRRTVGVGLGLLLLVPWVEPVHPILSVLLILAWTASPVLTWWVSKPRRDEGGYVLPEADRAYLHQVAEDTWRFFETVVGPEDHHLPPDNLQCEPDMVLAHRTSPTNMGLYLLSVCCARQFGWIDSGTMAQRLEDTLATMEKLPRHRGHWYNWYDTQGLVVLPPAYVSTVDSGNLSGCLLAVAQACLALREGTQDAVGDRGLFARLGRLAERCQTLGWATEYGFLLDKRRGLFHVGYRVDEQQLDASYYDLLASECRLTSLIAIGKGDVPVSHWARLGRPMYARGADLALRSWSGSMFEYLMPSMLVDEPCGSVLHSATRTAIAEQRAYGLSRQVPWGISESAYAARDHTLAYQYGPQGVPRLALRRTPLDELVLAPYATLMAVDQAPAEALRNLRALEAHQARGRYGFFESLDFTPSRVPAEGDHVVVQTYMSHHQGMALVTLANLLLDGAPRRWSMSEPALCAVASLLHERLPIEVSAYTDPPPAISQSRRSGGTFHEIVAPQEVALAPTQLLSNGRYTVAARSNGSGWSRRGRHLLTRYRDDALRDAFGHFFFVRHSGSKAVASLTQHPAADPRATYGANHHADRVCYTAAWPTHRTRCTVWVSPEDDIEFRRIEITNEGDAPLRLELMSYLEVTLSDPRADESHPAFTNLFIQSRWDEQDQALYFERAPRLVTEPGLAAVHFIADSDKALQGVQIETDRRAWLGRGRDLSAPQATYGTAPAPKPDTGLDPIASLSGTLVIPARGKSVITFASAVADAVQPLADLVDRYRQKPYIERSSLMSSTLADVRLRDIRMAPESFGAVNVLSTLLDAVIARPADATLAHSHMVDRRSLWRLGISGDRPILLVSCGLVQGMGVLRALVQGVQWWAWAGLPCDVVVINTEPPSYLMPLHREIQALRERCNLHGGAGSVAALHVHRTGDLSAQELTTLRAIARIRLTADGRSLPHHVAELKGWHDAAQYQRRRQDALPLVDRSAGKGGALFGAQGEHGVFDPDSGAYGFTVTPWRRPARPWVNVMANPGFGTQLSEAGSGYTWGGNSRLNQLTPWSNDPVSDPGGEWLVVQDNAAEEAWTLGAACQGGVAVDYEVSHGIGLSRIRHRHRGLAIEATWTIDPGASVKQVTVEIRNLRDVPADVTLGHALELMMGAHRQDRLSIATHFEYVATDGAPAQGRHGLGALQHPAVFATQLDHHAGFGGSTLFLALKLGQPGEASVMQWTADRREFYDGRGARQWPLTLGAHSGLGLDPCAALALPVAIEPGQSRQVTFLIGYASSAEAARALCATALKDKPEARLERVRAQWRQLGGAVKVSSPDPLFDALVNHWLLYQTVSCRLWSKAGFYQAGGAYG
ncbi:MAG: carbohydrate-binding protein, partial [Rubrivivax sp.]